jgi:two-component system chemotaxis response regulator CheB
VIGVKLVTIGASLGGIDALHSLLKPLPTDFGAAVAVVLHRRPDSESRLAEVIGLRCALPVCEPEDKAAIKPGHVYLAPADYHLLVEPGQFALSIDEPECFSRPSVNVLFESAADAYGRRVCAVVLTGSSDDGAEGLAAVRRAGGVTVVQDPSTAESPVAPRAALARGTVDHVLALEQITPLLVRLCKGK